MRDWNASIVDFALERSVEIQTALGHLPYIFAAHHAEKSMSYMVLVNSVPSSRLAITRTEVEGREDHHILLAWFTFSRGKTLC